MRLHLAPSKEWVGIYIYSPHTPSRCTLSLKTGRSVSLSVCQSVCLSVCLSVSLSACQSVCLPFKNCAHNFVCFYRRIFVLRASPFSSPWLIFCEEMKSLSSSLRTFLQLFSPLLDPNLLCYSQFSTVSLLTVRVNVAAGRRTNRNSLLLLLFLS